MIIDEIMAVQKQDTCMQKNVRIPKITCILNLVLLLVVRPAGPADIDIVGQPGP